MQSQERHAQQTGTLLSNHAIPACVCNAANIDELAAQVQGCLRNSTSDVYRYLQPIQGGQGQVGLRSMKLVNTIPPSFLSSPTASLTRTLTFYLLHCFFKLLPT
jgi:hypothetical protein